MVITFCSSIVDPYSLSYYIRSNTFQKSICPRYTLACTLYGKTFEGEIFVVEIEKNFCGSR